MQLLDPDMVLPITYLVYNCLIDGRYIEQEGKLHMQRERIRSL